jgi:hypothetical protein
MINSKKKGARIEREFAKWLRDLYGYSARRGQQYSGSPDSPDVVCEELNELHLEVKGTQNFSPYKNYEQATNDAGENQIPLVIHKKNRGDFMVFLSAKDFFNLIADRNFYYNKGKND